MAVVFGRPIDGPIGVLAAPYTLGAGVLSLDNATRLGTVTPADPVRLTVVNADGTPAGQFLATARVGNLVTVAVDAGWTDTPIAAGLAVGVSASAAAFAELQTAIRANAVALAALIATPSGVATVNGSTGNVVVSALSLGLATVATTGAYADLAGRPTLGTLAPLSPTGTASASTFLRGDGAWATPPSGGGSATPGGTSGQLQWGNAGAFAGLTGSSVDTAGNVAITGNLSFGGGVLRSVVGRLGVPQLIVAGTNGNGSGLSSGYFDLDMGGNLGINGYCSIGNGGFTDPAPGQGYDLKLGGPSPYSVACLGAIAILNRRVILGSTDKLAAFNDTVGAFVSGVDSKGVPIEAQTSGVPATSGAVVGNRRYDPAAKRLYLFNGSTWDSVLLS